MQSYKLRDTAFLATLLTMLFLLLVWLVGLIGFFKDSDYFFEQFNYSHIPHYISLLLCIAAVLLVPFLIYHLLDNAFSCELKIDDRGVAIGYIAGSTLFEWNRILYSKEVKLLGFHILKYFVTGQSVAIFNRGILGKLFFWVKTKTVIYSLFEDEAEFVIDGKLNSSRPTQ
jgi:hypothetical protein